MISTETKLATFEILTVLTRFLETGQEVKLDINIVRILSQPDFIPGLSSGPSSGFLMAKNLLIDIQEGKICVHSFQSVRLVDLCIDVLQGVQRTLSFYRVFATFVVLAVYVWLEMQCSASELLTVYSP